MEARLCLLRNGKLIDFYNLSVFWKEYRISHTDELRGQHSGDIDFISKSARDIFNALQLEKLWAFVGKDHLDRERVVMTNLTQAIEFCLKAIKTHAEYRETKVFKFEEGHNLNCIFDTLPETLRLELRSESVVFAEKYTNFRRDIEEKVMQLHKDTISPYLGKRLDVTAWKNIADEIEGSTYTAFVNANDPVSVSALGYEPEVWFDRAIQDIGEITYHRYSPFQGKDEYPTVPIHLGLMLGRYFYEHLFPIVVNGK